MYSDYRRWDTESDIIGEINSVGNVLTKIDNVHLHVSSPPSDGTCNLIRKELNPNAESFVPNRSFNLSLNSNEKGNNVTSTLNPDATPFAPKTGNAATISIETQIVTEQNPLSDLNKLRCENLNRIIFGHLNLNSIRNKFEILADIVKGRIDIMLISETKIDPSFLTEQFKIEGFSTPYRLDRKIFGAFGGGLLLYVREDIPSKLLKLCPINENFECFFIEINLYKKKWLICGNYNPKTSMISNHLHELSKCLDSYLPRYDNVILMGDFNAEPSLSSMNNFCELYNLKNLVKEPTCFKNPENPKMIDLILTNKPRSFQNTTNIETGISDCHMMTVTVMKSYYKKAPPKIISYRDYKNYSHANFRKELDEKLLQYDEPLSYDKFESIFMEIFDRHAPLKYKYLRANQSPFITKELRKEIMLRSQLRNKFIKKRSDSNNMAYKKQRNVCTTLLRKAKREYYSKLNPALIADNKKIWKTVKPLFSEKYLSKEAITIIENNEIITDDKKITEIFNTFFSNCVEGLGISIDSSLINHDINGSDPVINAISKYSHHPSILKIKEVIGCDKFSFSKTTPLSVFNQVMRLNNSTSCPKHSIPIKVIKDNIDLFTTRLEESFNLSIDESEFPINLKFADISPVHKKDDRNDKVNYRPVSILPAISKIYERLLFYQINDFIDKKLSMHQCGFRQQYNAQYCLILAVERWKRSLDQKGSYGALLTDLSKAFDCLLHDLLIAKLHAYGFDHKSLQLMHGYLTKRNQRVRINSNYSSWSEIITGVPQGSILGPLLFNIYLSDLFLFTNESNIANYADDNTPYSCEHEIEDVIVQLEKDSSTLIKWVSINGLKANPDKFHLLLNSTDLTKSIKVDKFDIFNSNSEKLLGITFDNKLTFNEHVSRLCKKASQKLHALVRVSRYMNTAKKRLIMKSFINSQFGYCPLVWLFHSRTLNTRINKIHERALRIVYDDKLSTFEDLLKRDKSVSIHIRNIQKLAIELFKVNNGVAPEILREVFPLKSTTAYPTKFPFKSHKVRTVSYGIETLLYLAPKIWNIIPISIKNAKSVNEFKQKIISWNPTNCPCKLCKTYVAGVGYVVIEQ